MITDKSFDVLCLTETWLKTNDYFGLNESTPPSYGYKHEPRQTGRGGGVATIYSDILNVTQKTGYRFDSFEIRMLNVKLSDMQNKSVLFLALATVYRPPGPCYRPGRTIIPATKDRFTNNLPDLSQLLCVPINTDELDTITSNMVTIFSNTLETVAPIKLKKVREKLAAPWYNSYTHSLKKETRILERKWRKTNLEVFRIAWKNSMSSYRQALKTARTEYIRKLIDNHQNNPRFLFSTVRLTN